MTHPSTSALPAQPRRLPEHLALGLVELTVTNLDRSVSFYSAALGMEVLDREGRGVRLGAHGRELLALTELPGAPPVPPTSPGLYHFAVLVPSRADLARWVRHVAGLGLPIGQADHLVSEAFYLHDPDGHGIEVYQDRLRSEWRWRGGLLEVAADPLDLVGLLAEPGANAPFAGLPRGTVIGHVHLRVTDLAASERFYVGLLGFDVMGRVPGALFLSRGGYHHHLGLNTWTSRGGRPAPGESARLTRYTVILPAPADVEGLAERLTHAGVDLALTGGTLELRDPDGLRLRFVSESDA